MCLSGVPFSFYRARTCTCAGGMVALLADTQLETTSAPVRNLMG